MSTALLWLVGLIAGYLGIGAGIGVVMVVTHLACFFAAGFRWRRMARLILLCAAFWPLMLMGGEVR